MADMSDAPLCPSCLHPHFPVNVGCIIYFLLLPAPRPPLLSYPNSSKRVRQMTCQMLRKIDVEYAGIKAKEIAFVFLRCTSV